MSLRHSYLFIKEVQKSLMYTEGINRRYSLVHVAMPQLAIRTKSCFQAFQDQAPGISLEFCSISFFVVFSAALLLHTWT